MGVQGKGQQTHHHALVGFRRMAGNGQGMIMVVVALHVRDLQIDFKDG